MKTVTPQVKTQSSSPPQMVTKIVLNANDFPIKGMYALGHFTYPLAFDDDNFNWYSVSRYFITSLQVSKLEAMLVQNYNPYPPSGRS